jgi:hypothetical protein
MIDALEILVVAFALAFLLEWGVIFLFGLRAKSDFLAVLAIILITNPSMKTSFR